MTLSPIVLFVYNRPWHTQQTIEALQNNELASESELFIYSDAAKNETAEQAVDEVRGYIKSIAGFKKVTLIEREKNWGLADSIIDGVTSIINQYGKIIVLEDDLVTSPYFLKYMNDSLECYESRKGIFAISGYSPNIELPKDYIHEVYLSHRSSSWGWATWRNEWNSICWENDFFLKFISDSKKMKDFAKKGGTDRPKMLKMQVEGKINSWAIRRGFMQYLQKNYTLFPSKTLVRNIGHDGSGIHCGINKGFDIKNELSNVVVLNFPYLIKENIYISKSIYNAYTVTLIQRLMKKLTRLLIDEKT